MNSPKILLLIACFVCVLPRVVSAQIVVTELMYDPAGFDSGHEWIELYNTGTSSVSVTELRLFEGGNNHKIKLVQGNPQLAPSMYAVIADNPTVFHQDYPNYTGQLFDSSFSLGNDGDTFSIKDKKLNVLETVTYTSALGAQGDGNSLQRSPNNADVFVARAPTPGAVASNVAIIPPAKPIKTLVLRKSAHVVTAKVQSPTTVVNGANTAVTDASSGVASVGVTPSAKTPYAWWVGLLVAVGVVVCAVVVIRHARSDEWDIVEESPEDV